MVKSFFFDGILYQNGTISRPRSVLNEKKLDQDETRNTSLLIPEKYYRSYFVGRSNWNAIIKHLLEESSSTLLFGSPFEEKNTIVRGYQSKGLDLVKISCRIEESLIIELEFIAQLFRISRCRLVAIMLELKELGWLKLMRLYGIVRGTTTPNQFSFSLTVYPRSFPKPKFVAEIKEIPRDS